MIKKIYAIFLLLLMHWIKTEENLKILIIGSGGREHALAWKVAQSPLVSKVYVAPGNAGTVTEKKVENVPYCQLDDLVSFAQDQQIDLTIVGPELPLAAGIVDVFEQHNLHCFGPHKAAAQLESSKFFAKEFMMRHHIPTAQYQSFTDFDDASSYINNQSLPLVIKANGLAAGKGVIIAHTKEEAVNAARSMLIEHVFGDAGNKIIVEEFLEGKEVTFIVVTDGINVIPLATSQDHKKLYDGDRGPNTGGMGAYSPAPIVTDQLHNQIMRDIIEPTIAGMAQEGIPYRGFLYAGLMISFDGTPKVLEFNCRLGDPETQPILMRLRSDLVQLCNAVLDGTLSDVTVEWDDRPALGVVITSGDYPSSYIDGLPISGLSELMPPAVKIFHAATAIFDNNIVTAGGRIMCVTALGDTIDQAQERAYNVVRTISFENMFYRTDIGSSLLNL